MLNKLRSDGYNLILLQDIHCQAGKEVEVVCRSCWGKDLLIAPYTHNARGVAILTNKVDIEYSDVIKDTQGNFIVAKILVNKVYQLLLINIYAPNHDDPAFFDKIDDVIDNNDLPVVIAGDWNLVLDQDQDTYGYRRVNNPKARSKVLEIMRRRNLIDVYRIRHMNEKRYTWRVVNPEIKQARLDFFLTRARVAVSATFAMVGGGPK